VLINVNHLKFVKRINCKLIYVKTFNDLSVKLYCIHRQTRPGLAGESVGSPENRTCFHSTNTFVYELKLTIKKSENSRRYYVQMTLK
jgi:hypothetical protein